VPQKIVIIYRTENIGQTGVEDGFCKMQLTINVPELTKASRLLTGLTDSLEQLRSHLQE
jgi:hypothetical protein